MGWHLARRLRSVLIDPCSPHPQVRDRKLTISQALKMAEEREATEAPVKLSNAEQVGGKERPCGGFSPIQSYTPPLSLPSCASSPRSRPAR